MGSAGNTLKGKITMRGKVRHQSVYQWGGGGDALKETVAKKQKRKESDCNDELLRGQ